MSSRVEGVPSTATLHEVAQLLARHRISCAVVFENGKPVGILSERDLVRLISEHPSNWASLSARETMTHPLHVTTPETSVVSANEGLTRNGIRRLPVVAPDGMLAGIITQTDLLHASHVSLEEYATDLERLVAERTAELRESEQRRSNLVDLTVHDIKNWIHAADASLELVAEQPEEAEHLLPMLRHTTKRIGNLVHTLLDIHRLESGWMPMRFREVPWSTVCDPIVAELQVMARTKSLSLPRSGQGQAIIRCDPNLVERIMLNLLDNAIHAAPEGTSIDIHSERHSDGMFRVRIGNRGPVIPPHVVPTLFGKYEQDETAAAKRYGWGLGLSFCQLAVEHHGGSIEVVSPYVDGEGTAFEFALPPDPEQRAPLPQ
jgi:signal transduction histidine kinase